MRLSKWANPKNGETRIYINDVSGFFGKKPFIVKNDMGNWEIKCFGAYQSQLDELSDLIDGEHPGIVKFDELLVAI